jgi:hypothetical protein
MHKLEEVLDILKTNLTTLLHQPGIKKISGLSITQWITHMTAKVVTSAEALIASLGTFHRAFAVIILTLINMVTHHTSNNNALINLNFAPKVSFKKNIKNWHVLWMNVQIKIQEFKSNWWIMPPIRLGKWIISKQLPIANRFSMQVQVLSILH